MSILMTCGFERRELVSEGVVQESPNGGTYETFVHPSGSTRSFAVVGSSRIFSKKLVLAADEVWIHVRVYYDAVPNMYFGLRVGTNKSIILQTNSDQKLTVLTGAGASPASTVLATGGTILGNDQWYNLHFHIKRNAVGFFRGYINGDFGTPDVEYSGNTSTVIDSPFTDFIFGSSVLNANYYIDDVVIMNPTDGDGLVDINMMTNPVIKIVMPTGDGAKSDQVSGTYADIDELPPSGSDYIRYDAIGQESTFTFPAQNGMVQILGKTVWSRIFRNDNAAGENIEMQIYEGGNEVYSSILPAPSDGSAEWTFETDVDGNPYNQSQFNSEQAGFRTAT